MFISQWEKINSNSAALNAAVRKADTVNKPVDIPTSNKKENWNTRGVSFFEKFKGQ